MIWCASCACNWGWVMDTEADLRHAVLAAALATNGAHSAAGNVSVRWGEGCLITPSGVPYAQLTPDMIVAMTLDGSYDGALKPSSEWRLHADIYHARPDVGAVVHTHAPHAVAVSCLRRDVPPFHYMIGVTGGDTLRVADYATFGTVELSAAMMRALDGRKACLLANHGLIATGATLDRAVWLAGEVESLCQHYILARQLGEPVMLDTDEMRRVLELFRGYGPAADKA